VENPHVFQLVKKFVASRGALKFRDHVHKNPPIVPILIKIKPLYAFPSYFLKCILILFQIYT